MYLWDHSLNEVETMTSSDVLLTYYEKLQVSANNIIKVCSGKKFKDQIAKLNTINIQLELYFFYLNISDDEDISDEQVIFNIRKDYKNYFYETLDIDSFWRKILLGCQIDQIYSLELIWGMDVTKIIGDYFENSMFTDCINWSKYKTLLTYFNDCKVKATSIIEQINNGLFPEMYPFLVGVESKCQMLIEELICLIQFIWNENEIKVIEEIEAKYICNVHERLLGMDSSFDKESLRYIVR